jgi:enoyl-CoA hydratase/carnithine racemase
MITVAEGFALGGGLESAMETDPIVAGVEANGGSREVRLGMMPGGVRTELAECG